MAKGRPNTLIAQVLNHNSVSRHNHSHGANEFQLVLSGKGTHSTLHEIYEFKKDSLHFFTRGQNHTHKSENPATKIISLRFRDEALSEEQVDEQAKFRLNFLKRLALTGQNSLDIEKTTLKNIKKFFLRAAEEDKAKKSGYKCILKGIALELIVSICRDKNLRYRSAHSIDDSISNLLIYIENNFARDITVEKAAQIAHLSRSHFHLRFKKLTGSSFINYLSKIRINHAVKRLTYEDTPVNIIAFESGFGSVSRFYEVFQKYQRTSPHELRKSKT
ncbi:MAG: helix-turn-helix domain-containing protein [Planctomycetota bacterium]|jgi:AraC-like DNA-binding protein